MGAAQIVVAHKDTKDIDAILDTIKKESKQSNIKIVVVCERDSKVVKLNRGKGKEEVDDRINLKSQEEVLKYLTDNPASIQEISKWSTDDQEKAFIKVSDMQTTASTDVEAEIERLGRRDNIATDISRSSFMTPQEFSSWTQKISEQHEWIAAASRRRTVKRTEMQESNPVEVIVPSFGNNTQFIGISKVRKDEPNYVQMLHELRSSKPPQKNNRLIRRVARRRQHKRWLKRRI